MDESSYVYLLAASVLHVFNPTQLKPWLPLANPVDPLKALLGSTVPAVGWRHLALRTLKVEERRSALKFLWNLGGRQRIKTVLATNTDVVRTPVQTVFERWIEGDRFDLASMNYDELIALGQVYDWDISAFGGLPDKDKFDEALRRRSAVSVFEHLVDVDFTGRDRELQVLRHYVGVVSPSLWQRLRSFYGLGAKPPLVLWGPGGVGKTALVGKFLLEHVDAPESGWFPFAYLPFDSESLDVQQPFTILIAACDQLTAQIEGGAGPNSAAAAAVADFKRLVEAYRDDRAQLQERASRRGSRRIADRSSTEYSLYGAFAILLNRIAEAASSQQSASKVPVLLVFDTFEEVYYRLREDLLGFWRMLETIQRNFPALRVIIAGRGRPNPFTVNGQVPIECPLDDLDSRDAVQLLTNLNVPQPDAIAIYRQIGGSPLMLRLAARVAQSESSGGGIRDLETKKYWFFNVAPEVIRGKLYQRVLDHIHDPDIKTLAHPGMILRRVTKEIIRDVLAPLCGLGQISEERAERLFEGLQREHALVSIEQDDALRYREEVRRPTLLLMTEDRPILVREIQEAIITFYEARRSPSLSERAEEIYHRLMLKQHARFLQGRWLPGVDRYLNSAIEEVGAEQQIWLAERMSIELPSETYARADLASWERLIGRKALETMRFGEAQAALAMLDERKDRTPESPLFAIEARAHLAVGHHVAAARLLESALDNYPPFGSRGRLAEILWFRSQAAWQMGDASASAFLDRLIEVCETLASSMSLIQALTQRLVLLRDNGGDDLRERLASKLMTLTTIEIDKEQSLIRLALVQLGANYPRTVASLIWRLSSEVIRRLKAVNLSPVELERLIGLLPEANRAPLSSASGAADVFAAASMHLTPESTRVIVELLASEGATLAGAGLAGLEPYREPWELVASEEAMP
ncbi:MULTISPECIES: ATP-binding protein [Bradyrhizobium]|uniref:ATP-binding protein n=1 Tax=Bradyrhizobium TaxID=374 RepID=UPI00131AFBF7|nr:MULTISPECIES: ATP-binding protein [Bradyrhizobium]UFW51104.1 ATP-binding protein [Bradyrhizobium arachidis]